MSIVIIVCGATSTGKSAYSFNLAKDFKAVNILSVDSRQFYKDLPIISGQDPISELPKNVSLFGQAILEATDIANITDFKTYANKIFKDTIKENKKLIIVGGSGLYLKAITENLSNSSVKPDSEFRVKAKNMSVNELQETLKKLNEPLFNSLNNSDVNNPRRLIRHIEISRSVSRRGGTSPRHYEEQGDVAIQYQWIGLRKFPEALLQSIKSRVITRLKNGAIDEVKTLLKKYPDISLPIYTTLGVKQILKFLSKEVDEEKLIEDWVIAENNYAKRQMVWFKKQPNIVWYDSTI